MFPEKRALYERILSALIAAECPPVPYLRDAKKFANRHIDTLHRARERDDLFAFQDEETGWWSTTRECLAAYLAGVPYSMLPEAA